MQTKICTTCKSEKPLSEFYPPNRHGKIRSLCKLCSRLCVQRSYWRHHESQLAAEKAYRLRMKREGRQAAKRPQPPQMFPLDAYQHDDILYHHCQLDTRLQEHVLALIVDNEFLRTLYEVGDLTEARNLCCLSDEEAENILQEARSSFKKG